MKKLIIFFLIVVNLSAISQTTINILPKPVELTQKTGYFNLSKSTVIIANTASKHNADMLNFYLKKFYGFTLQVKNTPQYQNARNVIGLGTSYAGNRKKDQYTLNIKGNKINIG